MDRESFERLYTELYPALFRLALSILRNIPDAQDAVQLAAVNAWVAVDRIKPGLEKPYITRIVVNECHNIQRQRQRIFCSQYASDGWYEQLGGQSSPLADAILDRIMFNSYKIPIVSADPNKSISMRELYDRKGM